MHGGKKEKGVVKWVKEKISEGGNAVEGSANRKQGGNDLKR